MDDIRLGAANFLQKPGDKALRHPIIRVQEENEGALRPAKPPVSGGADAAVGLGEQSNPGTGVAADNFFHNFGGIILAAVVDHQDFHAGIHLRKQGGQSTPDESLRVVRGDNHAQRDAHRRLSLLYLPRAFSAA